MALQLLKGLQGDLCQSVFGAVESYIGATTFMVLQEINGILQLSLTLLISTSRLKCELTPR